MTTEARATQNGHAEDAQARILDALGNEFTPESVRVLREGAIPLDRAVGFGVRSVRHPDHVPEEIHRFWVVGEGRGPGMLFPWNDLDRTVFQFRPDVPVRDELEAEHKYVFPKDCGAVLNHLRDVSECEQVLLVEGTKQSLSAAVWAPEDWGIVGMSGCWGWRGADLSWCEGKRVMLLMDQDVHTNRDVYEAAAGCKEALEAEGAEEVTFVRLPGAAAKDGLDDVLGKRAQDRRTGYLERICRMGEDKLGRAPARRGANPYMGDKGLLARTASLAVLEGQPAALAAGSMIALYRDGAFRIDREREPLIEKVKDMLGEDYRPNWRATIEEYLVGELYGRGLRLPDRMSEPILNCVNGMVDLKTGELLDHDPSYLSSLQIPVKWDPEATCPVYERWLHEVVGDQAAALEEVAATMLDPSRTPQKAVFGFGPSRSGKSTFLRIMAAIAGVGNTSAVTLHQLADNKFMAANIYGKMLNVAADLSAAHVEDTSLFKMLTGEDPVAADRKYGKTFQFTNRALFAFSANDIPTVSETSRAYVQRIAPFRFGNSFAGKEDPSIEETILRDELPGVLRRWVERWREFSVRGEYLAPAPDVAEEFEAKSDRVARWVATRCDVHEQFAGQLVGPDRGSLVTELYNAFKVWTKDDGGAQAMTRPKFGERLRAIPGVTDVRLKHKNKNLGLNVTTHTGPDREIGRKVTEEPVPVDTDAPEGVGGVGSVGTQTSSTYVGTQSEMIKEEVSDTYGKDVAQPTLPTPPTPPVRDPFTTLGESAPIVETYPEDPFAEAPETPVSAPETMIELTGTLAWDIETPSAKTLFTFRSRPGAPYARLNGLRDEDGKEIITTDPAELIRHLDAAPVIHGHNIFRFDLMALAWHHGADYDRLAQKAFDTYVDATVTDPPGSKGQKPWAQDGYYGLDQVAARLGLPGKTDHLPALARESGDPSLAGKSREEDGYGKIPVGDARYRSYLSGDLKAQDAVYRASTGDGERMDYRRREQKVAYIQNRMTLSGWKVDVPLLADLVRGEQEKVAQSLEWLSENAGVPLTETKSRGRGKNKVTYEEPRKSPLGSDAGKEALKNAFRERGLPYYLETASGALALNKDALGEGSYMVGKGAGGSLRPGLLNPERMTRLPEADWAAIRELAGHISRVTTSVQKYAEIQQHLIGDRVHAKVGETQGSRRWAMVQPSVTNMGKRGGKVAQRAPMTADDGCMLIAFDFDQVDMRAFAGHCGDPEYVGMFVRDEDPHSMIANMVFNLLDGGCDCPDKTRHTCHWRERSKASGHGWNYGLSVNGMVNSGIERALAERFDAGMNEGYPVLCSWRSEVRARAGEGQLLDNGFGALMRCDPARAYTQAPALMGQGTARDIMCEGLLRLPAEYIPWLRGVVHDEAVFNVPEDRVQECTEVVTAAFTMDLGEITQGRLHSVPIVAGPSKAGFRWSECYAKD